MPSVWKKRQLDAFLGYFDVFQKKKKKHQFDALSAKNSSECIYQTHYSLQAWFMANVFDLVCLKMPPVVL